MNKILIVDDETSIRDTFSIFLQRVGHTVHEARTVAEAEKILSSGEFDVVISDIILPGDSGTSLLDKVRELHARCPVIMITGQPTIDNAAESLRQGAFDYLVKPVRKNDLLHVFPERLSTNHCSMANTSWSRKTPATDCTWKNSYESGPNN